MCIYPKTAYPRLAIFDLDGTLIHNESEWFYDQAKRILHDIGYPSVDIEAFRNEVNHDRWFTIVPETDRKRVAQEFWERFEDRSLPPARAVEGVTETLEHFTRQGTQIAIATARKWMPHELEESLRHTGILRHLSLISSWGLNPKWSDKSEQLAFICRDLGLSPREALMAGDSPRDITDAKRAGLGLTAAVLSGNFHPDVLRKTEPNFLLPDVTHLPKHLSADSGQSIQN